MPQNDSIDGPQARQPTSSVAPGPSGAIEVLALAVGKAIASFHAADQQRAFSKDPEATHDARVALRRLRSILRSYKTLFDRGFASSLRGDLGWYATLLGDIRDLDVTTRRLEPYLAETSEHEAKLALSTFMEAERGRASQALVAARGQPRYERLLAELDRLANDPPLASHAEQREVSDLLVLMRRPWRDVREAGRVAKRSAKESDLHLLRVRAKELRYAAELVADALGPKCANLARAARDLQDRIGEHRDARRTITFLEEFERSFGQHPTLVDAITTAERRNARRALDRYRAELKKLARAWRKLGQ